MSRDRYSRFVVKQRDPMSRLARATFRLYEPAGYPKLHFDMQGVPPFDARVSASGREVVAIPMLVEGGVLEVVSGERLTVPKYLRLKAALEALQEQARTNG